MSEFTKYKPENFSLQVLTPAAKVGTFVVGISVIGGTEDTYTDLEAATFTYDAGYTENMDNVFVLIGDIDNYTVQTPGTLIYDSETASLSISYWGDPPSSPLKVGAKVRATYQSHDDDTFWFDFVMLVDTLHLSYHEVPEAANHGAKYRTDVTASLMGLYAVMLSKTVCWRQSPTNGIALPQEDLIHRYRRWLTIENWPGD